MFCQIWLLKFFNFQIDNLLSDSVAEILKKFSLHCLKFLKLQFQYALLDMLAGILKLRVWKCFLDSVNEIHMLEFLRILILILRLQIFNRLFESIF